MTSCTVSAYGGPGVAAEETDLFTSAASHFWSPTLLGLSDDQCKLTEGVFGQHGVLQLTEVTRSHRVLCSHSEDVERPFVERRDGVLELLDCGVNGLPGLPPDISLLHHVVGYGGAPITAGHLPFQVSVGPGDVAHLQPLRW